MRISERVWGVSRDQGGVPGEHWGVVRENTHERERERGSDSSYYLAQPDII